MVLIPMVQTHIVHFLCDELQYRQSVVDPCLVLFGLQSRMLQGKIYVEGVIALATDDLCSMVAQNDILPRWRSFAAVTSWENLHWGDQVDLLEKKLPFWKMALFNWISSFIQNHESNLLPFHSDRKRRKFSVVQPRRS